jgi:hypothetical protein
MSSWVVVNGFRTPCLKIAMTQADAEYWLNQQEKEKGLMNCRVISFDKWLEELCGPSKRAETDVGTSGVSQENPEARG